MKHDGSSINFDGWEQGPTFEGRVKTNLRLTHFTSDVDVRDVLIEVVGEPPAIEIGDLVGVHVSDGHFRPYYVVDLLRPQKGGLLFSLCVRRCFAGDGSETQTTPGLASNHICDRKPGDTLAMSGPYGKPFRIPDDRYANLLMIGVGTGIAPFRAFVKLIYQRKGHWRGDVKMFYGARSGMEMLYMNDQRNDFGSYESEESFEAFQAVCKPTQSHAVEALSASLKDNQKWIWDFVRQPQTHVYVAGNRLLGPKLDAAFSQIAGGDQTWAELKSRLIDEGRWQSVFY